MQFISDWVSQDKRTLLHFSDTVLAVFGQHVQTHQLNCEAGGLLLGSVHGSHMLIEQATMPTQRDKRLRHLFERLPFGHKTIALSRWTQSGGTVRYLGEWHTHPQNHPRPSDLDRSEWRQLAVRRKDGRPLLAVIVGRKSLHVECVPRSECSVVFVPK